MLRLVVSQKSSEARPDAAQPDEETVRHLRQMLREAEAGTLIGVVAATHHRSGELGYVGAGSLCQSPALGLAAATKLARHFL